VKIEVHINQRAAARAAATALGDEIRAAVKQRGRCVLAVSGGRTPWVMYRALARQELPWEQLQIVQVDERIAPLGDPDRNLTHLRESLLAHAPMYPQQVHPMPVESTDLQDAARQYELTLREFAGSPPVIDIVHLGLGPDGHTASLVPGDPVLNVSETDVATTRIYQKRRRMTLTYPAINRARRIFWIVTGQEKTAPLARMLDGDPSIPAGRVNHAHAVVIADRAAAARLEAA
jgi:6-phosphogluconolactonase